MLDACRRRWGPQFIGTFIYRFCVLSRKNDGHAGPVEIRERWIDCAFGFGFVEAVGLREGVELGVVGVCEFEGDDGRLGRFLRVVSNYVHGYGEAVVRFGRLVADRKGAVVAVPESLHVAGRTRGPVFDFANFVEGS